MYKNKKKYISVVAVLSVVLLIGGRAKANYSDPGSESDPIVTKSYIDKKYNELKNYVDKKNNELKDYVDKKVKDSIANNSNNSNDKGVVSEYIVVELSKGQKLIGDASTEMIVRAGRAKAIDSDLGGIADLTEGIDLKSGQIVKNNHHILIPRNDGRGTYIESDHAVIMIKGSYTIK